MLGRPQLRLSAQGISCLLSVVGLVISVPSRGGELRSVAYSIGNPSDDEQLLIELVNRLRSNPGPEAADLASTADPDVQHSLRNFEVDTDLMVGEFSKFESLPPLAPNANLGSSARLHSEDMEEHVYQGHLGSDGAGIFTRVKRQGYAAAIPKDRNIIGRSGIKLGVLSDSKPSI